LFISFNSFGGGIYRHYNNLFIFINNFKFAYKCIFISYIIYNPLDSIFIFKYYSSTIIIINAFIFTWITIFFLYFPISFNSIISGFFSSRYYFLIKNLLFLIVDVVFHPIIFNILSLFITFLCPYFLILLIFIF